MEKEYHLNKNDYKHAMDIEIKKVFDALWVGTCDFQQHGYNFETLAEKIDEFSKAYNNLTCAFKAAKEED